jgi:hypothetical protein
MLFNLYRYTENGILIPDILQFEGNLAAFLRVGILDTGLYFGLGLLWYLKPSGCSLKHRQIFS